MLNSGGTLTRSAADDFPNLGAEMVVGEATLVAVRVNRKLDVHKVKDHAPFRTEVSAAVGHPRRDPNDAVLSVAEDEAHRLILGCGAGAAVVQHEEQLRGRWHIPHIRLTPVQVKGLDCTGLHFAVVHLAHDEPRELGVDSRLEPAQLRDGASVVVESLQFHEFNSLDTGLGFVVLNGVGGFAF